MKATLKVDKPIDGKRQGEYSQKGDEIKIISIHDNTLIVENIRTKVRFSAKECEVQK